MKMRAKARENLLVATVNEALERNLITLECEPIQARCEGGGGRTMTESIIDSAPEQSLLAIAEDIKAEAGVLEHHVLSEPVRGEGYVRHGWSYPKRGIIHAPAGRTDRELYTLAHECAHVALRHDHRKPLWRREYEAELWAQDALRRHGVARSQCSFLVIQSGASATPSRSPRFHASSGPNGTAIRSGTAGQVERGQIVAVQLDQIERIEEHADVVAAVTMQSKLGIHHRHKQRPRRQ
jgi:hypothetical protein